MTGNLFADIKPHLPAELIDILAETPQVRIERIVSTGQASPDGFWYDQTESEWVLVLQGAAVLRFADSDQPLPLQPGDHVWIHPHRRHRVEWTTPDEPTVWLAIFITETPPSPDA